MKDQPPETIELLETVKVSLPQTNKKKGWEGIEEDLSFAGSILVNLQDQGNELRMLELTVYVYLAGTYQNKEQKPYHKSIRKDGPQTNTLRDKKRNTAKEFRGL